MGNIAIPSNGTIPLTEIVRARVGGQRLAMPVDGAGVVQLRHITALPAGQDGAGYSFSRLQAIDRLIERIQLTHGEEMRFEELSPVEKQEKILEEAARQIVVDSQRNTPQLGLYRGLMLDMVV